MAIKTTSKPTPNEMGWQSHANRNQCGNCFHLDERYTHEGSFMERAHYTCAIGGFKTSKGAICERHQRRA